MTEENTAQMNFSLKPKQTHSLVVAKVQGAGTDVCICLSLGLSVWSAQLVHRLRAKGPERGPPQSAFLPDLGDRKSVV